MNSEKYALEHFYFGQRLGTDGKPDRQLRLLGTSAGIKPDLVRAAVERINLPPLTRDSRGAWGLFRGNRQLPFLLVHSQIGSEGGVISHYILIPSDVLRVVGGSVRALEALLEDQMPKFTNAAEAEGVKRLEPLSIGAAPTETAERQIDDILELMTMLHNRLDVMERLLGAIVQNMQIIIQGAPSVLAERVNFIEGLLALLPPSVRFAVTFSTHSLPTHENDAQIRFYSDDLPPRDTVVYNWPQGHLTGEEVDNDYSRFVMSQLRLDTQLVIDRTRALVPATGWRMRQGDKLAEALTYGSYRLKIDEALMNNQPVSKEDVEGVLRDDPTLPDDLRALYARHLLTFTLAMNAPEQADSVAALMREKPELIQVTYQQLNDAIGDKQAGAVAATVLRWLDGDYGLEKDDLWVTLAARAVVTRVQELTSAQTVNADTLSTFVNVLQSASPRARLDRIIPRLMELLLPAAAGDARLAENVFLLAAEYLNASAFRKLLEMKPFTDQLRMPLRQLLAFVRGINVQAPPIGFLVDIGRGFGELWEALVTVRLAELALETGRRDLVDLTTLRGMAGQAATPQGRLYAAHFLKIAETLEAGDMTMLGEDGGVHLLRIRLACGDYAGMATGMIQQSGSLYGINRQGDYLGMVERLFADTPMTADQSADALEGLAANGIKSAPLLMAVLGSLKSTTEGDALEGIAEDAEAMLVAEPRLLQVVPPLSLNNLLDYYARRGNITAALRVSGIISGMVAASTDEGANALPIVTQMYRSMERHPATKQAGLDVLRAYIRQAEEKDARVGIAYYGRELGGEVRAALEATYVFRRLRGSMTLTDFAEAVKTTVGFLLDTASAYADGKNTPDITPLNNGLSRMGDSYPRDQQRIVTRTIQAIMQSIVNLHGQHRASRPRDVDALAKGNAEPISALDSLRVVGGFYNGSKKHDLKFLTPPLAYPLGGRSRRALMDELRIVAETLGNFARAFADKPTGLTAPHLRGEAESLLSSVEAMNREAVRQSLAHDLQTLVGLVEFIGDSGDARVAEDNSASAKRIDTLKQRPKSVLELYRYLYAYFAQRG